MGEMADLFLSSQDDDCYEEDAMQGYSIPYHAALLPTLGSITSCYVTTPKSVTGLRRRSFPKERACPTGCWVDKNGEVQEISKMTDRYLNNLIRFLEKNPILIKQNCASFEQMIEERYRRRVAQESRA